MLSKREGEKVEKESVDEEIVLEGPGKVQTKLNTEIPTPTTDLVLVGIVGRKPVEVSHIQLLIMLVFHIPLALSSRSSLGIMDTSYICSNNLRSIFRSSRSFSICPNMLSS